MPFQNGIPADHSAGFIPNGKRRINNSTLRTLIIIKKYEKENRNLLLIHQNFVKAKRNEINLLVKGHKYSA